MKNTHSLQKKRKPEFPKNTELIKRKKNNPKNPYHYFFSSSQSKKKRTPETVIEIVLKRGTMK